MGNSFSVGQMIGLLLALTVVLDLSGVVAHGAGLLPATSPAVVASSSGADTVDQELEKWRKSDQRMQMKDSCVTVAQILGKPLRDANFWARTTRIYSSYKLLQLKNGLVRPFQGSNALRAPKGEEEQRQEARDSFDRVWDAAHDRNSKRMIDLCLTLRGFYLKTGQFLGTRHDFMPTQYTDRLSRLHDDVPPMDEADVRRILERELRGPVEKFFTELDLKRPVGAASIAQVHVGIWRSTGEKVAVKIQYPNAERLMTGDLKNLRALAEFLQRTEFKFDLLSSIKELQKQIVNEFDFLLEGRNMDFMRDALATSCPEVNIPRSVMSTQRLLVMTFVEGDNLCRLAEFKKESKAMPLFVKQRVGRRILDKLAKVWGEMIFELRFFNADPHPGNINLGKKIGVLDWGQMKRVTDDAAVKFSRMILAICTEDRENILTAFADLGIKMSNPDDKRGTEFMALSMLDTKVCRGIYRLPPNPNTSES